MDRTIHRAEGGTHERPTTTMTSHSRATALRIAVALGVCVVWSGIDAATFDHEPGWYARLETSAGAVVIRLLPEQAPQSVAHFAALAEGRLEWTDPFTGKPRRDPYYNGLAIHRVAAAQRFEVGDPTGTGRGSAPVYVPEEGFGPVDFRARGRVGMTRASLGRISGSLFFVTAAGLPWLNGRHPCFGIVVHGLDVVDAISVVRADANGKPLEPIVLQSVKVYSVGEVAPLPEPVAFTPQPRRLTLREGLDSR